MNAVVIERHRITRSQQQTETLRQTVRKSHHVNILADLFSECGSQLICCVDLCVDGVRMQNRILFSNTKEFIPLKFHKSEMVECLI